MEKTRLFTQKLLGAIGILVSLLLAVGWLGLSRMGRLNVEHEELLGETWKKVELARQFLSYSNQNSRLTIQIMFLSHPDEIPSLLEQRSKNVERISAIVRQVEAQGFESQREKQLFESIMAARAPYVASYNAAEELLLHQRKPNEARQMMIDVVFPRLIAYHNAWEAFASFQGEQLDESVTRGRLSYLRTRRLVLALTGLAVLCAFMIGAYVTGRVDREIRSREQAERAVLALNSELEGKVRLRTSALADANHQLQAEVADRLRAEETAKRARELAEDANRAKSTFLATMSHEIRTPMNGVLGMTELVLDTDLTADQRESLGLVRTSAESLLSIINDILDFSKIEAGRMDLESIPFAFRRSLTETMRGLSFRAQQKGLELICEVEPEVADALAGDPGRIRQILINLVGNAIKFTERGEIFVQVAEQSQAASETVLRFSVTDSGIGIPVEKQVSIFDAFSQADGSTARKFGGTGLGLTICARLVEMMGGRIWVESQSGCGSAFHFTARFGLQAGPSELSGPLSPKQLTGETALIVDDNSTNRRVLSGMLVRFGMNPTVTASGQEALKALYLARDGGRPFRLILLDGHMPGMDGFALAETMKSDSNLMSASVMMLTSAGNPGDAKRCRELGIAAYLLKPVCQNELLEAIRNILGTQHQAETPLITRHSLREMKSRLRILLAEDNAVNQRLAVRLLEKRGFSVAIAQNGREALAALAGEIFDLVLMDVQMPEMDGLQATAAIRQGELSTGGHVPIIAMTAHALKSDQQLCLATGMDGYVSKPFRAQELFEAIESVTAKPRLSEVSAARSTVDTE